VGALQQWDATMGRIMGILDAHQVTRDTLIWITSDNGLVNMTAAEHSHDQQKRSNPSATWSIFAGNWCRPCGCLADTIAI
jgi:arylsulfatase A-like enzyme